VGYIPVIKALLAGAQTGAGLYALVKVIPSEASASKFGNFIVLSPYIGKKSGDWSSATSHIILGGFEFVHETKRRELKKREMKNFILIFLGLFG
jgi:hypothetical protein